LRLTAYYFQSLSTYIGFETWHTCLSTIGAVYRYIKETG